MADSVVLMNQRELADAFNVSKNTIATWRLPRVPAPSSKGTEVFYDVGVCLHIVVGRSLHREMPDLLHKPSDLEALALGYIKAPGVRKFSDADMRRFFNLAKRGGFERDASLVALSMAASVLRIKIHGISSPIRSKVTRQNR